MAQEKLSEAEAQACLGLLEQGKATVTKVALLSVANRKSAAGQVTDWLGRPGPLLP